MKKIPADQSMHMNQHFRSKSLCSDRNTNVPGQSREKPDDARLLQRNPDHSVTLQSSYSCFALS